MRINTSSIEDKLLPKFGLIAESIDGVRIHEVCEVRIHEGKGKKLDVKLISHGLSKNRNYYSKEVAESVADLILERSQMYLNHGGWFSGRGLEEIVAIAISSYKKDGKAFAIAEMANNPNTMWLYEFAQKFPKQVGASIDAYIKGREAVATDGKLWGQSDYDPEIHPRVQIVEEIRFLNSVDFVTYAAAGGGIEKVLASHLPDAEAMQRISALAEDYNKQVAKIINHQEREESMSDKLTLGALKENHSDLVKTLKEEWKTESKEAGKIAELESTLEEQVTANETLTEDLKTAKKDHGKLQTKIDEFELKDKIVVKREKVQTMLSESDLDKENISDIFIKDLMKLEDEEIQERIKDRQTLIEDSNGEVTSNGQRKRKKDKEIDENGKVKFDPKEDESGLVEEIKHQSNRI